MANQPTTDSRSTDQHNRHRALYERRSEAKFDVERRAWISKEAKVNYLQKCYREEFPELTESDLSFIECIGWLEVKGWVYLVDDQGNQTTRKHYITEGHRWLIDYFDPNLELLKDLGLLETPRINGDTRERIIHRRYWDLTPSGRALVDLQFSGQNTGDVGERGVHRLGNHMARWWCEEQWGGTPFMAVEPYPTVEGAELDLCVWSVPGNQYVDDEDVDKKTRDVIEIETSARNVNSLESDAIKMAHLPGKSWWIFPTREILVDVLNELSLRGYTGLEYPVPETLPMKDHRDTYNKRLAESRQVNTHLPYSAVDGVLTYKHLADDLKEWRPELFYGPRDQ